VEDLEIEMCSPETKPLSFSYTSESSVLFNSKYVLRQPLFASILCLKSNFVCLRRIAQDVSDDAV